MNLELILDIIVFKLVTKEGESVKREGGVLFVKYMSKWLSNPCIFKCPLLNFIIYYIKLKSRLSVCIMLITQPCLHGLKRDLLDMEAVSLRITKFIFKSLHVQLLIHTSALKALM